MRELLSVTCFLSLFSLANGAVAATIETPQGARQPQVAIDADGNVHLTFGADESVFYSCSSDDGATFSRPVKVGKLKSLALGMRRGPRIAASTDSIVISAIGTSGDDEDGNLYTWRSVDQGSSWQEPLRVNDTDASAREGLHGMAAGPHGEVFCTWLDLRHKSTQIFGSRSTDGGATWSPNVRVYESPDGTVCECCHPSVAVDETGRVHVMWRNFLDGNRDMYLATSLDRGKSFGPAVKLGAGAWPLNACPMDGGAVAVAAKGKLVSVWRREHEVFLTDGGLLKEKRLGVGMQPWVAANRKGTYAVWLSGRNGKLYSAASTKNQPLKLADRAQHPVVAGQANAHGPVIVAWESAGEAKPHVEVRRIDLQ